MSFPMEPEIDRDRWGRPMVVPPEGGQPTAYTRCTTYVGCLDDTFALGKWQQRMVAIGMARRPDLQVSVNAHADNSKRLDELCENALEAAAANAAATTGTALHSLTEQIDRGSKLSSMPPATQADLDAYVTATQQLEAVHIERFCVEDELKIGGTPDRVVEFEGKRYIADLKTGSVDYAALKISMQLAVYAHSQLYDIRSHERSQLDVDQQRAIVIHLPAGGGKCRLMWADIAQGWDAVRTARDVRSWRTKGRRMLSQLDVHVDEPLPIEQSAPAAAPPAPQMSDELVQLRNAIASAKSADELSQLWRAHQHEWNDELTQIAAARKALLVA